MALNSGNSWDIILWNDKVQWHDINQTTHEISTSVSNWLSYKSKFYMHYMHLLSPETMKNNNTDEYIVIKLIIDDLDNLISDINNCHDIWELRDYKLSILKIFSEKNEFISLDSKIKLNNVLDIIKIRFSEIHSQV